MADNRIGDGNVPLKLDGGEEVILKPSWGAAQAISRQFGGIQGAVERVVRMDMDATVQVVLFGLGYNIGTKKAPADLAERIWKTGFTDGTGSVGEKTVQYLHILANGGKSLPDEAEGVSVEANPSPNQSTNAS